MRDTGRAGDAEHDVAERLHQREAELARVQRIGQVGGLEVDLTGGQFRNRRSPEYLQLHGLPEDATHETHEAWVARIHAEDRQRVVEHFKAAVAGTDTDYTAEYRIIRPSDGALRWILAKAEIERGQSGEPLRLVGAHIDVTARRVAEEEKELLARELAHRIKNVFAVVQGVIMLSARSQTEHLAFARAVSERIAALAQATQYVAPGGLQRGERVPLLGFLRQMLAPYDDLRPGAVTLEGDEIEIGPRAATAFALMVHELATNAVKYGALAGSDGRLALSVVRGSERVEITWRERSERPIARPARQGFGTELIQKVLAGQFRTGLDITWLQAGLDARLAVAPEHLAR
ncbi:PAS domain-containing protein [Phreatobacter oligotrophus]|jgi:PAS domain S-box-containing protein|uniref:Blue-light-activated histidine kinase n=1 Tax=Phreatobacter oligotrophus TaxID=1122261 RepID=A0A2T4YYP3_9HYPH|nr:PAS domain S-box-containing protein [Phreatobacter oligotrophus]